MAKAKTLDFSRTFVWHDSEGSHLLLDHKDGYLKCSECGLESWNWCPHIEDSVRAHADAESIWNIQDEQLPHFIEVPMYPSAMLWAPVELRKSDLIPTALRIVFYEEAPKLPIDLGFINPGDGRLVMRSMLIEYFESQIMRGRPFACESSSHGYKQEMKWQDNCRTNLRIFEYWSIYRNKVCLACWDDIMNFSKDLVPSSEKEKFSSFNPSGGYS